MYPLFLISIAKRSVEQVIMFRTILKTGRRKKKKQTLKFISLITFDKEKYVHTHDKKSNY